MGHKTVFSEKKGGVVTTCRNLRVRAPASSCLGHAKTARCVRAMSVKISRSPLFLLPAGPYSSNPAHCTLDSTSESSSTAIESPARKQSVTLALVETGGSHICLRSCEVGLSTCRVAGYGYRRKTPASLSTVPHYFPPDTRVL